MSQHAWETAMGMRGYSGSPAEREDRNMTMNGMILGLWLASLQRKLEEGKVDEVIEELRAARAQLAAEGHTHG